MKWPVLATLLTTCLAYGQTVPGSSDESIPNFGTTVVVPFGLAGKVYFLPPDTDRLPNFDKLVPVGQVYTNRLNVQPRDFTGGFPGLSSRIEWFAIDYSGRFWVDTPGNYKFSLLSDDGSRLYIDDRLEIDNDGVHGPVLMVCSVALKHGAHRIRVYYFQGPRYTVALVLAVARPGEKWRIFNTNDLKPPPNTEGWTADDLKALEEIQKDPSRNPRNTGKEMAAADTALDKISGSDLPHEFAFQSALLQFPGVEKDNGSNFTIAYDVPLDSLKPQIDNRAETRTWRFLLLAIIRDEHDKIVEQMKLDVPFAVPEGQARSIAGKHFMFARNFHLPAGKYRFTAGVADRSSGKITADALETPADSAADRVRISNLVMVDHLQPGSATDAFDPLVFRGQRLVPMLSRSLTANEPRTIFFIAKPDSKNPDKPKLEVEFLVNGVLVVKDTPPLPAPDDSGLIPVSFSAPTRPGKCELRLTAVQGNGRATRSITYEVAGP